MKSNVNNVSLKELLITSIRAFFKSRGFTEVFPTRIGPISLVKSDAGVDDLFSLTYYKNEDYFLSQTSQNLLEKYASELGKCFTVVPCYRRQKAKHLQGLSEFWSVEAAWDEGSVDAIIQINCDLMHFLYDALKDRPEAANGKWNIEWLSKPFNKLKSNDGKNSHAEPVFIVNSTINPYDWTLSRSEENPELSEKVDFVYPALNPPLQLLSGGVRNKDYDDIMKRFDIAAKLAGCSDVESLKHAYKWYFDFKKNLDKTLCGFGLGIERLMMCVLGCNDIINVCDFEESEFVRQFVDKN